MTRILGGDGNSRSVGVKKHMKRLPAPRSWAIPRKTHFGTGKPAPGPHPGERSVPIGIILRDMLKVCDSAREARSILNTRGVLVDGRITTNPKFPVGFMDVLSLQETKAHYRMTVNTRGRMTLVPVDESEAKWKLCRIEDKTTVRGGKTQLNLHDGRNILLPKDQYKTGTTLKIQLPTQKVVGHYDLAPGAVSFISGGRHIGEIARVLDVRPTRNPRANVVTFKEGFSTDVDKVFVIGKDAPEVTVPEAGAL